MSPISRSNAFTATSVSSQIYEGTSDIQRLVIAREIAKD